MAPPAPTTAHERSPNAGEVHQAAVLEPPADPSDEQVIGADTTLIWPSGSVPLGPPKSRTKRSRASVASTSGQGWLGRQVPSISRAPTQGDLRQSGESDLRPSRNLPLKRGSRFSCWFRFADRICPSACVSLCGMWACDRHDGRIGAARGCGSDEACNLGFLIQVNHLLGGAHLLSHSRRCRIVRNGAGQCVRTKTDFSLKMRAALAFTSINSFAGATCRAKYATNSILAS